MANEALQVHSTDYTVFIGNEVLPILNNFLKEHFPETRIFILVDENTREHCLPLLRKGVPRLQEAPVIEIKSGEQHKTLDTCAVIWRELHHLGADRHSMLINLGGGVIGDMGGFAASTFKRGINFLQVPTTLLAQLDASVGGKLGVDLDGLKNQIGVFNNPKAVFIYPPFLETLDQKQVMSGFAEGIKHALIFDELHWEVLQEANLEYESGWERMIGLSVRIKNEIVLQDQFEVGPRKVLNFGHTIGHAVESQSFLGENPLLHGEAIAVGIVCESYLSNRLTGLSDEELDEITSYIKTHFDPVVLDPDLDTALIGLMYSDKKNSKGRISFTLLNKVGEAVIDQFCEEALIREALDYYRKYPVPEVS